MVSFRWTYALKADIEETERHAKNCGFSAKLLEGQSRTHHELYPLNQVKISGGNLSSDIFVHVGPSSAQMYYYVKEFPGIEEMEKILDEKEDAERVLNSVVVFAQNETARFGQKTAKPVMSKSMIKLLMDLMQKFQDDLNDLQSVVLGQTEQAFAEMAQGKMLSASTRIDLLSREIKFLEHKLTEMKKQQGITET